MFRRAWPLALALAAFVGCNETTENEAEPAQTPANVEPAAPPAAGAEGAESPQASAKEVTLTEDEIAAIKELPEEEQAIALAQKVCPISGENLGSMGKPLKVEADGETLFLCCKGCTGDFEADPKKALETVKAKTPAPAE